MNWTVSDYVIAGLLVAGLVASLVFASKKAKTPTQRTLLWAAIIIVFVLIWAELAVGLFGTPLAGD